MKKILLSIGSILFAGAILAGGTGAFMGDNEVSTGNTFANGVIDLKVDNESYVTDNDGKLVFSPSTSWELSDLAGKLFFNFSDLKPGDVGEDTISLHVNNNNAWACMSVKLKSTPENGQNEPEALVDGSTGVNQGELQKYLYFAFWADDGDNVYERGEKIFKKGLAKDIFDGQSWTLADSKSNIWQKNGWHYDREGNCGDWNQKKKSDPIPGNTVRYVGKAWCFGDTIEKPVTQDGYGKTGNNGPLARGTGFKCLGEEVGNIAQSDGISLDVSFSAVQSRSNSKFICKYDDEDGGNGGDNEYCSHGYWKQEQHFDSWSNYLPSQKFSSVFEDAFPNKTLLEVMQLGGGGLNRLGRETVGALLNAGSVDFPYSQSEVIAMFNAVYPGSSSAYNDLVDKFALPENCPLN